jgi:uncharacterized radical SAM superfamily Fe-S cluster-containing enzyme
VHALFVDLLPPETGISDPCEVLLVTTGRRQDRAEPVVLIDRRLAEASAPKSLEPLAALRPTSLRFDGPVSRPILLALASLGVQAVLDEEPGNPWHVDDYGSWTQQVLLNGLVLAAQPVGACKRPGFESLEPGDIKALQRALDRHVATVAALAPDAPETRTLAVTLTGDAWFHHPWTLQRAVCAILDSPCHLVGLRLVQPEPLALLTAIEEALVAQLRQPSLDGVGVALQSQTLNVLTKAIALEIRDSRPDPAIFQRLQDVLNTPSLRRWADNRTRIAVFRGLRGDQHRHGPPHRQDIVDSANRILGPTPRWIHGYRRHIRSSSARVVLLPTWQCELRCVYCAIQKTDGKEMTLDVAERSLDLLFSAPTETVQLAFFGGEPFLRWDLLKHTCAEAQHRATRQGRRLQIQITTNGWAITEAMVDTLGAYDIEFQLSVDGNAKTQNAQRKARLSGGDSYRRGPANKVSWFRSRGIAHSAIMVVPPAATGQMVANFQHLVDLGFESIQLNYAIGAPWEASECRAFADGLHGISGILERAWSGGRPIQLVNLQETVRRVRNNLHVTVDHDGRIYGGNAFLFQAAEREAFVLGHLQDNHGWHRYMVDGKTDEEVFAHWKRRASVQVTQRIGAVEADFVRWMQARHPNLVEGDQRQAY